MAERTVTTKRGFILYDGTLMRYVQEDLFSPGEWGKRETLRGTVGGRGQAWIVQSEDGEWVLRHYRRGGLVAHFISDYYLWTGLQQTRPWREWRLLSALYKQGLPVPQPVAAHVRRYGLVYLGDLITRLIPETRSLAARLQETRAEDLPWDRIGACIRRFHDAAAFHADLNAHNILIDVRDDIFLIDFDRSELYASGTHWKAANLRRLRRSLHKLAIPGLMQGPAWPALMEGYARAG